MGTSFKFTVVPSCFKTKNLCRKFQNAGVLRHNLRTYFKLASAAISLSKYSIQMSDYSTSSRHLKIEALPIPGASVTFETALPSWRSRTNLSLCTTYYCDGEALCHVLDRRCELVCRFGYGGKTAFMHGCRSMSWQGCLAGHESTHKTRL